MNKYTIEDIKKDGMLLKYIEYKTNEICLEAVKQNGYAIG